MSDQTPQINHREVTRVVLWGLIAIYTLLIPNAIYVYRFIEERYGLVFAGKIPLVIVLVFGGLYVIFARRKTGSFKNLLYLLPCVAIVLIIFNHESNPNKHIHIPEYVVLAWMVYAALSRDYRGSGMFALVFILTSMLGVVDELEQGLHPGRSYGWSDMLVNSSSALIGVFMILGVTRIEKASYGWVRGLKRYKELIVFNFFGLVGAVLMCIHLFAVQANEGVLAGVYPVWLVLWNVLFIINAPFFYYMFRKKTLCNEKNSGQKRGPIAPNGSAAAKLWLFPALLILLYMHTLPVFGMITGQLFK